jgi:exonuclease SbcD
VDLLRVGSKQEQLTVAVKSISCTCFLSPFENAYQYSKFVYINFLQQLLNHSMRILHTADWHLGKRLDYYSRLEEQKAALGEICQIADEKEADLVIIAGDLFDTYNPPNEATEHLYKTLKKLAKNGKVPVVAIAGNHDSPDRVNVADVLARENGIIFIGHPTDKVPHFEIENGFKLQKSEPGFIELNLPNGKFPARILHTAFANERRLKEYFGEDKQQPLQESLSKKWKKLADTYCDEDGVNILATHLYMMKHGEELSEEPDGEKPLHIGNADVVYSDAVPKQIQYTALGHLHRYQDVGADQPAIYSSSLLRYSFSEAGQQKYVSIVDAEPGEPVQADRVPLKSGKNLKKKTFHSTDEAVDWLSGNQDCLAELTLETDEFLKSEDRKRLYQAHDGIIYLIPKVKNTNSRLNSNDEINLDQNIQSLFRDYFKAKNDGQEPNDDLMSLFNEIRNA